MTPALQRAVNLHRLGKILDREVAAKRAAGGGPDLDQNALRSWHGIAMAGLSKEPGFYCRGFRCILGSDRELPPPAKSEALMQEYCDYLNENWDRRPVEHLLAFALWRFIWVHPFGNGNGRTARAVCHVINRLQPNDCPSPPLLAADPFTTDDTRYRPALLAADADHVARQCLPPDLSQLEAEITADRAARLRR